VSSSREQLIDAANQVLAFNKCLEACRVIAKWDELHDTAEYLRAKRGWISFDNMIGDER
jgi:hypothetical protein